MDQRTSSCCMSLLETNSAFASDPMDMAIVDKVCQETNWPCDDNNIVTSSTFSDSVSVNNNNKKQLISNKLLFLTVEYIDDQAKDFGKIFPFNEAPFLSRASSPLSDFEHRVSPHDPNMSSAARYSPTPVPMPSSPFNNPVAVMQEPASPLISTSEAAVRINNGYTTRLPQSSTSSTLSQSDNSQDFTDSTSDGLVTSVGNELMLIQNSGAELETTTNPLILSEISGSDLALTRDFLAMQEEQISIMNGIKLNSSLACGQDAETILPHEIDEETNAQISPVKSYNKLSGQREHNYDLVKKDVNWSRDQIDGNNLWYEDCDSTCTDAVDCNLLSVCTIADQPVPSRAIATLPSLYLSMEKLSPQENKSSTEFGIFAKKSIRRCTQFGPIEGILCPYDGSQIEGLPLLLESKVDGAFKRIDVTDEKTSNWMRFVRPAKNYEEQNLVICQRNEGIIFLSTRNINPGEELRAGPSAEYGKRRNLKVLEILPKKLLDKNSDCCTQSHAESEKIELTDIKIKHEIHEDHMYETKLHRKRKAACISFEKYLDFEEDDDDMSFIDEKFLKSDCKQLFNGFIKAQKEEKENTNSENSKFEFMKQEISQSDQMNGVDSIIDEITSSINQCTICLKNFTSKSKFDQHCLAHKIKNNNAHICNICFKTFLNNSSLTRHLKTHQKDKPTIECLVCEEAFGSVLTLKDFSETHLNQDETFTCPHCPKSFNSYALTRKHARSHHFDRKHECQFCLKCFPAADKLRMHLLKHSDRREFQCANCGKQFKRKDKLKDHVTRVHYSPKVSKDQVSSNNRAKKSTPKTNLVDCDRFIYKCRRCQVGFKRRGMLVNHLAKRHPDVPPDSVPELSLPILRQTRDYYCQYCDKVYKSSSKRKAHIMKNHPGAALPPSNRNKEYDIPGVPNPTFSQAAGSIKTAPQGCQWCHKQYASKAKLLQHQRKKHSSLMEPADQIPRPRSRPPQNQNQPPTSTANNNNNNNKNNDKNNNASSNSNDSIVKPSNISTTTECKSESLNDSSGLAFLKPQQHVARVNGVSSDLAAVANGPTNGNNNGFELLNPTQFVRVRDMR
ncbi:hypothetical protein TKK_0002157 [Trichogramma kaykai]|uniref:PR domain zinc finger protein 10 n=1 Tax=Trichogramma kaykai TaxID=54128 RepID=A0ABD2XBK1_9HYME